MLALIPGVPPPSFPRPAQPAPPSPPPASAAPAPAAARAKPATPPRAIPFAPAFAPTSGGGVRVGSAPPRVRQDEAGGARDAALQRVAQQDADLVAEVPLRWGEQPLTGQIDSGRGALAGGPDASACVADSLSAGWTMMGGDMAALDRLARWGTMVLAADSTSSITTAAACAGLGVRGAAHPIRSEIRAEAEAALQTLAALRATPRDAWTELDRSRLNTALYALADAYEDVTRGGDKNSANGLSSDTGRALRDVMWGDARPIADGVRVEIAFVRLQNADGEAFNHAILATASGRVIRDPYPDENGNIYRGEGDLTFHVTSDLQELGHGKLI